MLHFLHWFCRFLKELLASTYNPVRVCWSIQIVAYVNSKVLVVNFVDVVHEFIVVLLFLEVFVVEIFLQRVLNDILIASAKLNCLSLFSVWVKLVVVLRLLKHFWFVVLCR